VHLPYTRIALGEHNEKYKNNKNNYPYDNERKNNKITKQPSLALSMQPSLIKLNHLGSKERGGGCLPIHLEVASSPGWGCYLMDSFNLILPFHLHHYMDALKGKGPHSPALTTEAGK
jgi:hypothetical protein